MFTHCCVVLSFRKSSWHTHLVGSATYIRMALDCVSQSALPPFGRLIHLTFRLLGSTVLLFRAQRHGIRKIINCCHASTCMMTAAAAVRFRSHSIRSLRFCLLRCDPSWCLCCCPGGRIFFLPTSCCCCCSVDPWSVWVANQLVQYTIAR